MKDVDRPPDEATREVDDCPLGVRAERDTRRAKLERIAVLGAGGFIGSHLVPALLARRGCAVDAVDVDVRQAGAHRRRASGASRRASTGRG